MFHGGGGIINRGSPLNWKKKFYVLSVHPESLIFVCRVSRLKFLTCCKYLMFTPCKNRSPRHSAISENVFRIISGGPIRLSDYPKKALTTIPSASRRPRKAVSIVKAFQFLLSGFPQPKLQRIFVYTNFRVYQPQVRQGQWCHHYKHCTTILDYVSVVQTSASLGCPGVFYVWLMCSLAREASRT